MTDAIYLQVESTAQIDKSIVALTNKSGDTLVEGAVCVIDTSNEEAFTTTTTADRTDVKVLISRTANDADGYLAAVGKVTVLVTGNVAKGDRLVSSTTAGRAKSNGASGKGFAVALTDYTGGAEGEVTAMLEQNLSITGDAGDISYTPNDVDDWGGSDPGDVDGALDHLARGNFVNIEVVIGNGEDAITTSTPIPDIEIPLGLVAKGWTIVADASGSIVIDVWKDTYANYPPTSADTITDSAKPTLSSAQKNQDLTLTGWTTAFAKGDWLKFNIDSASTVKLVTLSIRCEVA